MYTVTTDLRENTCSTPSEVMAILKARGIRTKDTDVRLIKLLGVGRTHYISGPVTRDVKATVTREA